jgi:hypothetical protein
MRTNRSIRSRPRTSAASRSSAGVRRGGAGLRGRRRRAGHPDADRIPGHRQGRQQGQGRHHRARSARHLRPGTGHRRLQVGQRQGPRHQEGRRQGRGLVCLRARKSPCSARPTWCSSTRASPAERGDKKVDGSLVALQARLSTFVLRPAAAPARAHAPQLFGRPQRAPRVSRRLGAQPRGLAPALHPPVGLARRRPVARAGQPGQAGHAAPPGARTGSCRRCCGWARARPALGGPTGLRSWPTRSRR